MFLLLACASSTQDLIEQAHLTGDWTAVNKRMDLIQKREALRNAPTCPSGKTMLCNKRLGEERCNCVRNDELRRVFQDFGF